MDKYMEQKPKRLSLAIQKSGRLADSSLALLEKCGIRFRRQKNQLFARSKNFPIDIYFVRDDDIPSFVASNICQIGIVGQNVLLEEKISSPDEGIALLDVCSPLTFGDCRLSIAVPQGTDYSGVEWLSGKTIATTYKGILQEFLRNNKIDARIVTMEGAVEIAPRTQIADAICDLVSTGSTLTMNGLVEQDIVLESQAVLVQNQDLNEAQAEILERFLMRLKGVNRAKASKYIMLHAPMNALDSIIESLPGNESPTIVPLDHMPDKVAVQAVCDEELFWDTMEELKQKGASSILVLPIEKMLD